MRTDKNRRKNVPADARPDERKAGTRHARRTGKAETMLAHQSCATHDFGPVRGGVQVCRRPTCGAVKQTALLAATERAQLRPGEAEFTVEGACSECDHLGWAPFNGDVEIQRCDNCSVFEDDDEAHAYAIELAIAALKNPRQRTGKRFEAVLVSLQIAADAERGEEPEDE